MLQKDGSLLISEWFKGQAKHPIYGFGLIQGMEVFENRGIAKLKNGTFLASPVLIPPIQLPIAEVEDDSGNSYTMYGNLETGVAGAVYKNVTPTSATSIAGSLPKAWDIAIHKNYLWIRNDQYLSAYGPLDSLSAQLFPNIDSGYNSDYLGKLLVGQDDFLYTGNGNSIAKITILSSGTPGDAPVLSVNKTALKLKDGQYATTFLEYGRNLIIGTQGGGSYFDRAGYSNAKLYPWNRQAGTLGNPGLADLPINIKDNAINAAVSYANIMYVSAGTQGNIYKTDGTNYTKIATIPYVRSGLFARSTVLPNAMSISQQGTLLIGLSTFADGYSKAGVYEVDISDPKYPIVLSHIISTGSTGESTTNAIKIGFVNSRNYQSTRVGWGDGNNYGIDDTDFRMYSGYKGIIESLLEPTSSSIEGRAFERVEFMLADPLVRGQNIRLSYRTNSTEPYKPIGAWGFADAPGVKGVGGITNFEDKASVVNTRYLQTKIEFDQAVSTIYGSNIPLIYVKYR